MVAYHFTPQHQPSVLDGSKPFTMRKLGKKRHARLDETIQLQSGRPAATFAIARCVFRAQVVFSADGLHRVLQPCCITGGDGLSSLFEQAEDGRPQADLHRQRIAEMAGFPDWAALAAFHAEAEDGEPAADGRLWREVVGWTGVEAMGGAATPALDAPSPTAVLAAAADEAEETVVSAAMQSLGVVNGCPVFWAAPGRFTAPGVYYWDGERNVQVPIPAVQQA